MEILDLAALESVPLQCDPFDFLVAKGVLGPQTLEALNRDYPQIDKPANFAPEDLTYGPSFQKLLAELASEEFGKESFRKSIGSKAAPVDMVELQPGSHHL